ncbi:hypothetical protein RQP53_12560 [Paucibacter sp. APW11]|uniref:Bacterial Ig-like domain-containing protein n=1 Tax=Roseateles aquae TaxID=3077235 RepID=A0ABU3PC12_9BURK|nr:hypothetical protein [Paucibacter sp. APW11]MDT9000100.1 hypothetical protein [Paucibacter sp. APW11]
MIRGVEKLAPWVALLLVSGLVGCGGGGGGGASTVVTPGAGGSGATSHAGKVTVLPPKANGLQVWVAYQDGDGPWKLAPSADGKYSFQVDNVDGRYAVMVVADMPNDSATVSAFYLTRDEAAEVDLSSSESIRDATHRVRASIVNADSSARCHIRMQAYTGSEACNSWQADRHSFMVGDAAFDASLTRFDASNVADLFVYQRDLKTSTDMQLSFDLAKGVPLTATQRIGLAADAARAGETLSYSATWRSAQGSIALNRSSTSTAYPTLPTASALPAGYYSVGVTALLAQGDGRAQRQAGYRSLDGNGQTVQLPPNVNPIAFGLAPNSAYPRPTVKWTPLPGSLSSSFRVDTFDNPDPSGQDPIWSFSFSSAWIKGGKTVDYTFPDLNGLGWNPRWYFKYGAQVSVTYSEDSDSAPEPNWYTGAVRTKPAGSTFWSSWVTTPITLPR